MSDVTLQVKPCPFCNGTNMSVGTCWDVPGGFIRCACGAMMQTIDEPLSAAIDRWNKRAENQSLDAPIIQIQHKNTRC